MKAYLSRRYHFSASHRLHSEGYTAEENRAVYGKCNNPFGHGHNYVAQVTVSGEVDPVTGMVCDLAALDGFAANKVLAVFDHTNLNTLKAFRELVPTTENLAIVLQAIFMEFCGARVESVHVEETGNNSFDYAGDAAAPMFGRV
jgi:6-pyruvoyltetrahydropterin/6-carboxytetrahydropterin synthase